jgi:hypothetical protein
MYIKDWFKPIFPHFLTRLLRKLKFVTHMVDFAPTNVISQSIPVACVCGRSLAGIAGSNPAEGMDVCLL